MAPTNLQETSAIEADELKSIGMLGKRLVLIREKLNYNQKEFAELLNLPASHLSLLESGKSSPGYKFLLNISSKFYINIRYLLRGEGPMFYEQETRQGMLEDLFEKINKDPDMFKLFWFLKNSAIVRYELIKYFNISLRKNSEAIEYELKSQGIDEFDFPK